MYRYYKICWAATLLDPRYRGLEFKEEDEEFKRTLELQGNWAKSSDAMEEALWTVIRKDILSLWKATRPLPLPLNQVATKAALLPSCDETTTNLFEMRNQQKRKRADPIDTAALRSTQDGVDKTLMCALETEILQFRAHFKSEGTLQSTACPLIWWKAHEARFPMLGNKAAYVLSIPASQAMTERLFSVGNSIVSINRCKLGSKTVSRFMKASANTKYNLR